MRRALLIAVVLVGCRQQATPLSNPFLAPDRVPPPATRTPPPGTAIPYYDGTDGTSVPSGLPPSGALLTPPGSWPLVQSGPSAQVVDADSIAHASSSSMAAADANRRLSTVASSEQVAVPGDDQRERFARLASHDAVEDSGALGTKPRPFPDIADLPPADSTSRVGHPAQASRAGGHPRLQAARDAFRARGDTARRESSGEVQTASYDAPESPTTAPATRRARGAESTTSPGRRRHGYAPDYAWLMGRLEYSQAGQQWRLRYVPIDGRTDEFGGSVILANPEVLVELAAGDFVRVEGTILEGKKDALSYAPLYRIGQVQPLAD